jgi:hypothetical protein
VVTVHRAEIRRLQRLDNPTCSCHVLSSCPARLAAGPYNNPTCEKCVTFVDKSEYTKYILCRRTVVSWLAVGSTYDSS